MNADHPGYASGITEPGLIRSALYATSVSYRYVIGRIVARLAISALRLARDDKTRVVDAGIQTLSLLRGATGIHAASVRGSMHLNMLAPIP